MHLIVNHPSVWKAFLAALLIAAAATPLVILLARDLGAIDSPDDERRVHKLPTPRLGGLAIMLGIVCASSLFIEWGFLSGIPRRNIEQLGVIICGAVAICALGVWDDVRGLSWRAKLMGQVGIAFVTIYAPLAGLATASSQLVLPVNRIDPPLIHAITLPTWLGVAVAALWIVALMNMLNFVDGVDGLAAGISAITAGTFAVIAVSYDRTNVGVLAAATCGAAIGFLPYNWRKGGARIFMGDSGSMLLGYLLAVVSLQGVLKTAAAVSLVTPLALLAIPILDTMFVVAKRLKHHQSLATPDRWHLHHRALNVGVPPRAVSAAFWLWTGSLSGFSLALRFADYGNSRHWHTHGLIVLAGFALFALAVTVWLAFVLEILKTPGVRARNVVALALIEREREQPAADAAASSGASVRTGATDSGSDSRHDADSRPNADSSPL